MFSFSAFSAFDSLVTSIFQPVSLAAKRTLTPSLPIASDSLSSGTITLLDFSSSLISTLTTSAGLNDEAIYSSIAFIVNNKDKSKPQEQVRYTLYKIKREKGVMKTFEYSFDFPKTADYLKKAQELDERLVKYAKNEEIPELVKKNFGVLPKAMSYSKSFYSVGVK